MGRIDRSQLKSYEKDTRRRTTHLAELTGRLRNVQFDRLNNERGEVR